MKIEFEKKIFKDFDKIEDYLFIKIKYIITTIEKSKSLDDIIYKFDIKKISGTKGFYRIRIGNYRLGFSVIADKITFIRCLHRKNIYKYFPKK